MAFLLVATYVILAGLIVYLLAVLHSRNSRNSEYAAEVKDTSLAAEELQRHAAEIARNHPVGKSSKSLNWLIRRLNDNFSLITEVYRALNKDIREMFPTAPAAEWLLDNFYIIEEQVKLIRMNLSRGRYSRLPILKKGYLRGYPRAYAIALEIVAHSNGNIDESIITSFIQAYQSQTLLSMGELWAIPLMLRIALIESIRNTCEIVSSSRQEWHRAEALIEKIVDAESDENRIDTVLDSALDIREEITPSFTEHLIQRLRKHGRSLSTVTVLLDRRLMHEGTSTEELTGTEHQIQAETQVAIGNSITGLRLISELDWSEVFEVLSRVEHILRKDPNGVYALMDFESRDHYRHEVEKMARVFGISEIQVAERAVECAKAETGNTPRDHVGYYLTGKGRKVLLNTVEKSVGKKWRISFASAEKPKRFYIGMASFLTLFLVTYFMYYASTHDDTASFFLPFVTALLVLIPCSELALAFTNTIISHIYSPTLLPKLELKNGIPEDNAAFVIIPTLLTSPVRAKELLRQMEVCYLANRERNLFFALVGDFKDADSETLDTDSEITGTVLKGITELNDKYSAKGVPVFHYMHRRRTYNGSQNRWMGWERKRGAIVEFNRLLRGAAETDFSIITHDLVLLPVIKYVITIDADTRLPIGTAKRLIGTIAHPLNRAVVSKTTGIVDEGYGVLQPRISVSIPGSNRSFFTRIFAGQGGIDPYTTAVSDIYQDIFDEGIFAGKGIYDVDIFSTVLHERIPDNTVLSHDLIEGCHLRAGLVSDVELVDGYPSSYNSYVTREHRWARGDWQLLPWLGRYVRNEACGKSRNNISGLCRWKILDNMRRSLLYPSLLLLLLAGIILLPGDDLVWIGFVVLATVSPLTDGFLNSLLAGSLYFRSSKSNTTVITGLKAALYQSLFLYVLIPHQTHLMLDAVIRTIYRVFRSRRNMLEWVTAADAEVNSAISIKSYYRKMWFSLLAAVLILFSALVFPGSSLIPAAVTAIAWLLAPLAAYLISKPLVKKKSRLSEEDLTMLRRVSRKTWRYFEDFSEENDNYLPPDNFQQDPPKGAAHRTSPTNIGLLLLSLLSAHDMGYIGTDALSDRLDKLIGTMERMEKWKGHFYNWYDTLTLETLRPLYVSTVDSGNLIGYMMVLKEGLIEFPDKSLLRPAMARGLSDTMDLLLTESRYASKGKHEDILLMLSSAGASDVREWERALGSLASWLDAIQEDKKDDDGWLQKLHQMVRQYKDELYAYYPFLRQPGSLDILSEYDTELEKRMFIPTSPNELLAHYKRTCAVLSAAAGKECTNDRGSASDHSRNDGDSYDKLLNLIRQGIDHIEYEMARYCQLIARISRIIEETRFPPLFDKKRLLFFIGYNAEEGHLSKAYYDLLASEARQASFIAIARGEADRRHWTRLGRKLTASEGGKGLVSWTGTMFEYMMPLLIMRNYENTILDETYSFVVRKQKKYCKHRGIPWGISESGYSTLDFGLNYQYKAFGVPELGLKRGLANDMVIAPYASFLALCVDPVAAAENLRELQRLGMEGLCGFYEAVDFTPSRLDADSRYRIVKSFMAHHQGMSLAALNNFFNDGILQKRFHNDPVIQSAELLLQEKMPARILYTKGQREETVSHFKRPEHTDGDAVRTYGNPTVLPPNVHILSNGRYSVMLTDGGSGYSSDGSIAINRWTPDYFDKKGFYIFIENINSNTAWSATYDPCGEEPEKYKVVFSPCKAEFTRRNGNIESYLEITVSPEDNVEIRRISITNHSEHTRIVELTSFFEAVLAPRQQDASHPAFSKLFVRTEFIKDHMCLLAARRQREEGKKPLWLVHAISVDGDHAVGDIQYETDRMKFIGRNRDITDPRAMEPDQPLSGSHGSVLDPVMSLRRRIRIAPGHTVRTVYMTATANSKKQALEMADKYSDGRMSERAFELAWTRSQVENRYLGLKHEEIEFYLDLIPFLLYTNSFKKEYSAYIRDNTGSQQDLWAFGISGDLPLMLVELNEAGDIDMVEWALKGHEYWRMKNLSVDLAILINKVEGYSQPLNEKVRNAVTASHARELSNKPGGVFVINSADLEAWHIALLYTAARLVVKDSIDSFKNVIKRSRIAAESVHSAYACYDNEMRHITVYEQKEEDKLLFFNGIGGFSEDGREYVIKLGNGRHTPLPWSNIIANRDFGFIVTESGGGYTWCQNSREFKLTPWTNDPVTDGRGEVFYISDMDEKCHWSLTPMPVPGKGPYTVRHGRGYSMFEHESGGIKQTLTQFAAMERPVKICIITLKNLTGRQRKLKVTYYIRPVLGVDTSWTSPYIVTGMDDNGILFIENKFSHEFRGRSAFMAVSEGKPSYTGDRALFMGLKGDPAEPAGLFGDGLNGKVGAGLDPCAALSCITVPAPEEEVRIVFLLGSVTDNNEAVEIKKQFLNIENALLELENVKSYWRDRLEAIKLHTPDDSFDVMMNGWLLYQTVACRLWARSGYYQAGGAFGFRDQLQDCMAVLNIWPELSRDQILLHASRQFKEGDVQHWWHAETGKGIRTRYSDDLLWLPYVTSEYIEKTGDRSILDVMIPFLDADLLREGEDERYEEPRSAVDEANLYEHCVRAIDRSLASGPHGLPLIGSGDWNDGMNTVGNKGSGESVWLGWFLICILHKFIPLCRLTNDHQRIEIYRDRAAELIKSIENEAWDGSWYRRAYFDDGTPLGSVKNSECMIDSISQSWSVISGVAKPLRAREAMAAVQKYLVDTDEGIVKLLTPPFDEGVLRPGYIKGYVPGVRENGGQYTHAASWVVLAFTRLGMGDKASEIFHMLNPINHTRTDIEYSRYKTEPYVMAADVYAVSPHTGRGGWTWYTGTAGWLYKIGLESIAGFSKKGERLYINPCIPSSWKIFSVSYRYINSIYHIEVKNPDEVSCGVSHISVDGKISNGGFISLSPEGSHSVEVVMGGRATLYRLSVPEPGTAGSSTGNT